MRYIVSIKSIWEFGKRVDAGGKPHQEDSIFPAYGEQKDTDRLFILCDGMGGHDAGEVASATVCEAMSRSINKAVPNQEGPFTDEQLQKAISDAFDALDAVGGNSDGEKKMGTTMTFLKLHDKGCTIAHMGDSRVYHIRPGRDKDSTRILFQTSDHSLVNDLIKIGELTPEEAKTSKQKNVITRAMQPKMDRRPKADVYHSADIKKGDYFYMCSDGMLEQMEDENICFNFSDTTGDEDNKVRILTQATSQNSDNHSAIIVHILDVIEDKAETTEKKPEVVEPAPIMAEVNDDEDSVPNAVKEGQNNEPSLGRKQKVLEELKRSVRVLMRRLILVLLFFVFVALLWVCIPMIGRFLPKAEASKAAVDSNKSEIVASAETTASESKKDTSTQSVMIEAEEKVKPAEPQQMEVKTPENKKKIEEVVKATVDRTVKTEITDSNSQQN